MNKPFDKNLIQAMQSTAAHLKDNIQNCKAAYVQSDEISLLLDDTATIGTDAWFGNKVQKMASIAASMATAFFGDYFSSICEPEFTYRTALFDARVLMIPEDDVPNYFIWRQRDWNRNSIQMLTRSMYSDKMVHGKNTEQMKLMCLEEGNDYDKLSGHLKNGTLFIGSDAYDGQFDYRKFGTLLGWYQSEIETPSELPKDDSSIRPACDKVEPQEEPENITFTVGNTEITYTVTTRQD